MKTKIATLIATALIAPMSVAETYMNFQPNDSLKEAKAKYPNASFTELKVGWTKPNDRFVQMTGQGIVGTIYLKFSHSDAFWESQKSRFESKIAANGGWEDAADSRMLQVAKNYLASPLEERLTLDWIRYAPPTPIPFERLQSKYGKPEKCDYDQETFAPFCEWTKKGVYVALSDDKKMVQTIEFAFTDDDYAVKWGTKPKAPIPNPKQEREQPKRKAL